MKEILEAPNLSLLAGQHLPDYCCYIIVGCMAAQIPFHISKLIYFKYSPHAISNAVFCQRFKDGEEG
jgi:hypothetical protein